MVVVAPGQESLGLIQLPPPWATCNILIATQRSGNLGSSLSPKDLSGALILGMLLISWNKLFCRGQLLRLRPPLYKDPRLAAFLLPPSPFAEPLPASLLLSVFCVWQTLVSTHLLLEVSVSLLVPSCLCLTSFTRLCQSTMAAKGRF